MGIVKHLTKQIHRDTLILDKSTELTSGKEQMPKQMRWHNIDKEGLVRITKLLEMLFMVMGFGDFKHYHLPSSARFSHYHPETRCNLAHKVAGNDQLWEKLPERIPISSHDNLEMKLFSPYNCRDVSKYRVRAKLRHLLDNCR